MDLLDRLNERLLHALAGREGGPDTPFTVAELYQELIPYRAVRGRLGIMELAPYEHALLRLLSGERGYVTVTTPGVADEIRAELSGPNPILGIYRDYAGVEMRLGAGPGAGPSRPSIPSASTASTESIASHGSSALPPGAPAAPAAEGEPARSARPGDPANPRGPTPEPRATPARPAAGGGPDRGGDTRPGERSTAPGGLPAGEPVRPTAGVADLPSVARPGAHPDARRESVPPVRAPAPAGGGDASAGPARCVGCAGALPAVPDLRFCPACGVDQREPPCGGCGAPVRPEWIFCVRCGSRQHEVLDTRG